jgi:MFS superfamily sulfate permease-like transporter
MWGLGRKQFFPFIIKIIIILATDLLLGICIGLLISVYYIVQSNSKIDYNIAQTRHLVIETQYIKLNHKVTFLNKVKLRKTLDEVPEYSIMTIADSESRLIDYDILEIISEFHRKARDRPIEFHLINLEKVKVTAMH